MQNVSEYTLVLALCLVSIREHTRWLAGVNAACEDGVPSEAWPVGRPVFINMSNPERRLRTPTPPSPHLFRSRRLFGGCDHSLTECLRTVSPHPASTSWSVDCSSVYWRPFNPRYCHAVTFISDIGIGYRVHLRVDIGYRHFPKFTYRSDTRTHNRKLFTIDWQLQ